MCVCAWAARRRKKFFFIEGWMKEKIPQVHESARKSLAVWVKVSCAFNWWINSSLMYFPYFFVLKAFSLKRFSSTPFPYFLTFSSSSLKIRQKRKIFQFFVLAFFSPFHVMIIILIYRRCSLILLFIYCAMYYNIFYSFLLLIRYFAVLYPRFTWEYSTFPKDILSQR
jgi:hypothetical protein